MSYIQNKAAVSGAKPNSLNRSDRPRTPSGAGAMESPTSRCICRAATRTWGYEVDQGAPTEIATHMAKATLQR